MNSLIYAGVVLAGALTLLIEAYRNFNGSLSSVPFREHPILQHVEVEKLCTRRERNIGFMFYSLLYLVTYTVVLSSTSVLNLLIRASEENDQIGPRDQLLNIGNDPFLLGGTDYSTPIFVSAAIIAIFSLGALRPVESTMRSLAHRLAGVPRGVYEAIERLHGIKYSSLPKGGTRSFSKLFEKNFEQAFKDSNLSENLRAIENDLLAIDYLSPAIVGSRRLQYFPFTQLETMHALSEIMAKQLDELRHALAKPDPENPAPAELVTQINAAFNDAVALFAVNFLRNNRAIKSIDKPKEPLLHVYNHIRRDYRVEMNSFAMAMLVSSVIGIAWAGMEYATWNNAARPLTDSAIRPAVEAALKVEIERLPRPSDGTETEATGGTDIPSAAPNTTLVDPVLKEQPPMSIADYNKAVARINACSDIPGANQKSYRQIVLPDDTGLQPDIVSQRVSWFSDRMARLTGYGAVPENDFDDSLDGYGPKCHQLWMAPAIKLIGSDRQAYFFGAFKAVFAVAMSVMLAGVTTIFARDVRRDDNSWGEWSVRRPPFLRLVSLAMLPAVLAVFGIVLANFLLFWFETAFRPTEQQITNFFLDNMNFHGMHLGTGFLVAIGILFLTDNHLSLKNEPTILIGLVFACLIYMWYILVIVVGYPAEFLSPSPPGLPYSFEWRETKIHAAQPALFIVLFAVFLEVTERDTDESGWWFVSLFKSKPTSNPHAGGTQE